MKAVNHVEKDRKVALCRVCGGTGVVCRTERPVGLVGRVLNGRTTRTLRETCPQCEGSGRVWVSCVSDVTVETYAPGSLPGKEEDNQ